MEATDLLNPGDPRPTEMISAFDSPHRLAVSWIYELPFGQGKSFGNTNNPVASRLLSGWQVTGIYAWQMGPPLNFATNAIFLGGDIAIPKSQQTLDKSKCFKVNNICRWFDVTRFVTTASVQPTGRNVRTFPLRFSNVRGQSVNNVDLSLFKNTAITEGTKLQIRFDLINALNHPWYFSGGQISMNPTANNFGQITSGNQANYERRVQVMLKFLF
jgi:hypothetical protein